MTDAKELMSISYKGAVRNSFDDTVVIAFETEDDIVEHIYTRDQFLNKELPEEETQVIMRLSLVEIENQPIEELGDLIDLRVFRKNAIEGRDVF